MALFNDKHYIWFRDLLITEKLQLDIDQLGQLLDAFYKDNKDFDPDILLDYFRNHYEANHWNDAQDYVQNFVNPALAEILPFPPIDKEQKPE